MREPNRPFPLKTAFAAAAIVCAAVGAVSGQAIGETPMMRGGTDETISSAGALATDHSRIANSEPLPDHYPLETPEGIIPVAELALHGRLRDRAGGFYASEEPAMLDSHYDYQLDEEEIEQLAEDGSLHSSASQRVASKASGSREPEEEPVQHGPS